MFIKSLSNVALAAAAGLMFASSAEASPRFTIENKTAHPLKIDIYKGGDTACSSREKRKSVGPQKTRTFGCTGDNKGKCKIKVSVDSKPICDKQENTCGGKAIKMDGGARAEISRNGNNFRCVIS